MTADSIDGMAKPGPKRGAPQRQWLSPDAADEDERVSVYAKVASRARARGRRAAAAAHLSFAAYVEALLMQDELDEKGCPRWAARGRLRPAASRRPVASRHAWATNVSEM